MGIAIILTCGYTAGAMEQLRTYLNALPRDEQANFAKRCGTSVGYLRKAISMGTAIGEGLCINIERESARAVLCEHLRADVDWAYIRNAGQPHLIRPHLAAQPQESANGN